MYNFLWKLKRDDPSSTHFKWLNYIQGCLNRTGFAYLWEENNPVNPMTLKFDFKQRCNDIFRQDWHSEVSSNSQCNIYRLLKENHCFEKFITLLTPEDAYSLLNFRTRTHNLPITKIRSKSEEDATCTVRERTKVSSTFLCYLL